MMMKIFKRKCFSFCYGLVSFFINAIKTFFFSLLIFHDFFLFLLSISFCVCVEVAFYCSVLLFMSISTLLSSNRGELTAEILNKNIWLFPTHIIKVSFQSELSLWLTLRGEALFVVKVNF